MPAGFISLGLGIISVTTGLLAWSRQPLVIGLASIGVALLAYRQVVFAVDAWRYPVQTLVHRGRLPLAERLNLRMPATLEDERAMWKALTGAGPRRSDSNSGGARRVS